MIRTSLIAITATVLLLGATACSSDDGDNASPTSIPGAVTAVSGSPAPGATPGGVATVDATEEALARDLAFLAGYVLTQPEAPTGFIMRANQPVARREAAVANIGITPVATFLNLSDLQGAWFSFFVRTEPESSISSRVLAFATPESATRYVEIIAGLQRSDYPAATSVERVQAADIGSLAQMMRYRVPGSRELEYSWVQGRFVGQIVLRYAGDIESTDDPALVVELARRQSARMAAEPGQ